LEIRVLGPLELVADAGPVPLPTKQRRLLAALAICVGETRSPDLLIDAVWGEAPPVSASNLLQVYVSQLRKTLPAPARIATSGSGYALDVPEESLDAARFERLLQEGREAASDGNPALAASLLRRALALWRGQAYSEFAYEQFAHAEAERLDELRLVALEERLEAELALGRHAELLPELQSLATAHPMRERLQAQMMLGLYRCGRQTEALELYADSRARLREELALEPGPELNELQQRILRHDPSLGIGRAATQGSTVLPAPPNALLGRERELDELRGLLLRDDVRLLVLTGSGGSGKTRLALEAAREAAPSFANGAAFVGLALLRDAGLVLGAISRALGVAEQRRDPVDSLATALRSRELLLFLDDAEHVRAAAPVFVELLARAPRLTLLVTSRAVLHLTGEHVYPVEPLPRAAAIALFHQRARESAAHFQPTAADEQAIDGICARIDGLPLAIELAASRVRALTPAELLARVEPRLPLLTGGPRDLPARQQTLRATLEWSSELLTEEERGVLCRLSVFAGGCTLEAAEAVAGTTLERLSTLVDHNLLRRTATAQGSRYSMLETIREYAAELLERSADAETTRKRHADYVLAVAESANLTFQSEGEQGYDVAIAEQDNARAALAWALGAGEIELGLELAVALEAFWVTHDPREGIRWFEALFGANADIQPPLRMRALRAYGTSLSFVDQEAAQRAWEDGLAAARELREERAVVSLLLVLANLAWERGADSGFQGEELDEARKLGTEALELNRRVGSRNAEAQCLSVLGRVAHSQGDLRGARELLEQSASIAHETRARWWEAHALNHLGSLARARPAGRRRAPTPGRARTLPRARRPQWNNWLTRLARSCRARERARRRRRAPLGSRRGGGSGARGNRVLVAAGLGARPHRMGDSGCRRRRAQVRACPRAGPRAVARRGGLACTRIAAWLAMRHNELR